jgi:hypothetical protein
VLASLLPLLGSGLALVLGNSLIGLLSHAMSISSVSTELAVLIDRGVGVGYGYSSSAPRPSRRLRSP